MSLHVQTWKYCIELSLLHLYGDITMIICKPDTLIKFPHDLSLVEQRVLNLAIHAFQKANDSTLDQYKLNIGLYAQLYGIDRSTAYKGLIDAITSLSSKTFYNLITNKHEPFFDDMRYERVGQGGAVFFKFSEACLHEFQHSPKTEIDLNLTVKLQSKYALHLYELFLCSNKASVNSLTFSIQDFRDLIGLGMNEYKIWSNLKTRVVDESVGLINKHTDLHADYHLYRENRRTSDISFAIRKKTPRVEYSLH